MLLPDIPVLVDCGTEAVFTLHKNTEVYCQAVYLSFTLNLLSFTM